MNKTHWIDILEDSSTKTTIKNHIFKNQAIPDLKNIYIYKWEINRNEFEAIEILIHFYFPIPKQTNKKVSEKSNVTTGNFALYPLENFDFDFNHLPLSKNRLETFDIVIKSISVNKIEILISSNYGNKFKAICAGISLLNFGYSLVDNKFFEKLPSNYRNIVKF